MYYRHLLKFSCLVVFCQFLAWFMPPLLIEKVRIIFSLPQDKSQLITDSVFLIYYVMSFGFIYFYQVMTAPKKPFFNGLILFILDITLISVAIKQFDPTVTLISFCVCIIATTSAIVLKKYQPNLFLKKNTDTNYFSVSLFKLAFMNIFSGGWYKFYWWYQQWECIKQRTHKNYFVLFRSLFPIFFYQQFLNDINANAKNNKIRTIFATDILTAFYVILIIGTFALVYISRAHTSQILNPYTVYLTLTFFLLGNLVLILPQITINRMNQTTNATFISNHKITFSNVIIILLLGSLYWLSVTQSIVDSKRSDIEKAQTFYKVGRFQLAFDYAISAAQEGNPQAEFLIAKIYLFGKKDTYHSETNNMNHLEQGLKWLEDAATLGHAEAAYLLGQSYKSGSFGLAQDYQKGAFWLQKAVDENYADAANDLAILYGRGQGVPKDLNKEYTLYQFAAKQGDDYAMYNLGLHYAKLIPENYHLAAHWYKKAIKTRANLCAMNDLGMFYTSGKGVKPNAEKSKALLIAAGKELLILHSNHLLKNITIKSKIFHNFELRRKIAEITNAFAQYQSAKAMNKNVDDELAKQYSRKTLTTVKNMSHEISTRCWE